MTKRFKWTVTFEVDELWVADGFDLTDDRALQMLAKEPGFEVDHLDGDGLNNTRANLRICTPAENIQAAVGRRSRTNKHGYRGVRKNRHGFNALVTAHGKSYHLGYFKTALEAAQHYDAAVYWLHGEFGCPNFPRENKMLPPITPEIVLALRGSVKHRGTLDPSREAATLITYSAEEKAFVLSAYGKVVALSRDPAVLGAILVQERAQAGFLAALLDTTVDPETACLDPAQRAARLSAIRAAAATVKHTTATHEANRRLQHLRPSTISLDDLLDDTP